MPDNPVSEADLATLSRQLGRDPNGVLRIERRCPSGHPLVILTHPLASTQGPPAPFPTLYWLTCPAVQKRLARLERVGGVSHLVDALKADPDLLARHAADQAEYARRRWQLLSEEERLLAKARGWEEVLRDSGVGGIRSPSAVKCLHLQAAYHLVQPTAAGSWIAERVDLTPCGSQGRPTGGSAFASERGLNTLVG